MHIDVDDVLHRSVTKRALLIKKYEMLVHKPILFCTLASNLLIEKLYFRKLYALLMERTMSFITPIDPMSPIPFDTISFVSPADQAIQDLAQKRFRDLAEETAYYQAMRGLCEERLAEIGQFSLPETPLTPSLSSFRGTSVGSSASTVQKRTNTEQSAFRPEKRRRTTPPRNLKHFYPPGTPVRYYRQSAEIVEFDEQTGLFKIFLKGQFLDVTKKELIINPIWGETYLVLSDKYYSWAKVDKVKTYGPRHLDLQIYWEADPLTPVLKRVNRLESILAIKRNDPLPEWMLEAKRKPGSFYFTKPYRQTPP